MILFFLGIAILAGGYFTYGKWMERIAAPTDSPTPGTACPDGVDFLVLPHWKNMLIQLLNIAGLGPVVGLILGIKFGPVVFILLPLGNILGGAVHDYFAGMMSIRHGGANLPRMVHIYMGKTIGQLFSLFILIILSLVGAVFINVPAKLIAGPSLLNMPDGFWIAVCGVFVYYALATLFPIDKIIGQIYPLFGAVLLFATGALFFSLCAEVIQNPELLIPSKAFLERAETAPIVPVLFVTIACGIISGFHATQSPIIARTMKSEHQGRQAFYGMMVLEGLIAMVWGGVGMAIYNLKPELMNGNEMVAMSELCNYFLGNGLGTFAIAGVVILAVTSGDTATRCLRLTLAEMLNVSQIPIRNRLAVSLPLFALIGGLLWWSNQPSGIEGARFSFQNDKVIVTQVSAPLSTHGLKNGDEVIGVIREGKMVRFSYENPPRALIYGAEKQTVSLVVASGSDTIVFAAQRAPSSFSELWRYFAWSNQILAAVVFLMCALWLFKQNKPGWVALIPGAFMTFVVLTFILWNQTIGLGLPLIPAYLTAGFLTLPVIIATVIRGRFLRRTQNY